MKTGKVLRSNTCGLTTLIEMKLFRKFWFVGEYREVVLNLVIWNVGKVQGVYCLPASGYFAVLAERFILTMS